MSDHTFNPFVAKKFGINIAVLVNSFVFWTRTNAAKGHNFHEDRFWCYGTPEYFAKYFPYFTDRQIKYTLQKCLKLGVLIKGNFNDKAYDKTSWYALSDEILNALNLDETCLNPAPILIDQICPIDRTNLSYASDKFVLTIPDNKTDNKTDTLSIISLFDIFWEMYPVKKDKKSCFSKWKRLKDVNLCKQIIDKLQTQMQYDRQWGDGFIPSALSYLRDERWEDEITPIFGKGNITISSKSSEERKLETEERIKNQEQFSIKRANEFLGV